MTTRHRSPNQSRSGSPYSGSSTTESLADPDNNITRRKGKQPDPKYITLSQLSEFRAEIMTFLNNFSKSQKEDFRSVNDNVSQIKDVKTEINKIADQLEAIKTCTTNITLENVELKKDISDLKDSLSVYSSEQSILSTRTEKIESEMKNIGKLQKDFMQLKHSYDFLINEHNACQQKNRMMNLEISELPEKIDENLLQYVVTIAKYAGVTDFSSHDIIQAHRVQPRLSDPKKPKNIVVQLASTLIKDKIISGIRRKKGITTHDLGLSEVSRNIYINEHLTANNKKLLKLTKDAAKNAKFKYVWIRNCKIFVRKDDTLPKLLIKNVADLDNIK